MDDSFEGQLRIAEGELFDLRLELESCRRFLRELEEEVMDADQWLYKLALELKALDPRSPVLSAFYQRTK